MNKIVHQQHQRGSLLIEGTQGSNVNHLALSIVGAGISRASLPRVLFLVDRETEGRDAVRQMSAWLDGYGGVADRAQGEKKNCLAFYHNTLAMKPGALANYFLEVEPACHPFYVVRMDDSNTMPSAVEHFNQYASAIRDRIKCTVIHVVRRGPMGELPVDPAHYEGHWQVSEYAPAGQERINDALAVLDHATGKVQVWRNRPMAGGPAIYFPALDEIAA